MRTITNITYLAFALFAFACFALSPRAQAQSNEGDLGNGNTVEGFQALFLNNTGGFNTALGWVSLYNNTDAFFSTGVGAGTLFNSNAADNTAVGAATMFFNTTGVDNTAVGTNALRGDATLFNTGSDNNAIGSSALFSNQSGSLNEAMGNGALFSNTTGSDNEAMGNGALFFNITGDANVAIANGAMGFNTAGSFNTTVGFDVGTNLILGNENIYIGDEAGTVDFAGNANGDESGVIRIGSFFSGTSACFINGIANNGPFADTVTIDPATGQLGGLPSSARLKKDIEPMGQSSEAIYSLKPVTFHYKSDKTNTPWFGLIAEDVAKVNPALIGVDKEGKPYCVAYDKVNAMLLNEFLKEHATVQELKKEIAVLKSGLQKVSAQLEVGNPAQQTVLNNR